ncbi:DUF4071 domain-containing protein [Metallumcola ferriviriculae]|uniref:DUF4071 domain-containing protein n=1 Tax=Metallumcola ferriviriculae TaxID=3039180 RepID=A0AAU0UID4_9FIRM|nr:DUF4071 domain-containing protein [Desulfitibacteraceae bacterium MK1]
MKPLLFVVMPFGKKKDQTSTFEIEFDSIYEKAIKPAAEEAQVDVIRADEERSGGIIHIPMFERLLLAEIVIADLTIQNPNVYYELGIRHCSRPRSTILIFAKDSKLPFDVGMVRALPYELDNGVLSDEGAERLSVLLKEKLEESKKDLKTADSPLFQVISKFPGINLDHDVTESFRDRAKRIESIREELEEARILEDKEQAKKDMIKIEESLGDFNETHSELLMDLMLSYRDIKAWDEMINLIEKVPQELRDLSVTINEQYAMALNRRNQNKDRLRATKVLDSVIKKFGASPENCGIYGRIYKDLYDEAIKHGKEAKALGYLDQAIEWYSKGFELDPRDYYPGINAATLLFRKHGEESLKKLETILPAVVFSVARRGGINSQDYWDVATALEAAVLGEDWELAVRASQKLLAIDAPGWNYETTINNLEIIEGTTVANNLENDHLKQIINILESENL